MSLFRFGITSSKKVKATDPEDKEDSSRKVEQKGEQRTKPAAKTATSRVVKAKRTLRATAVRRARPRRQRSPVMTPRMARRRALCEMYLSRSARRCEQKSCLFTNSHAC